MNNTKFMISDAAKQVGLETHVLRYWEVELNLPIKRTELGHRYYTLEDIQTFRDIKKLKDQGLQLKAIRILLINGTIHGQNLDMEKTYGKDCSQGDQIQNNNSDDINKNEKCTTALEIVDQKNLKGEVLSGTSDMIHTSVVRELSSSTDLGDDKFFRLQMLLKDMIGEVVKENNRELCEEIKGSILKEMDYQFRLQEERDEAHFKSVDELLRSKVKEKRKRKKHSFF